MKHVLFLKKPQIQRAILSSVVSKGGLGLCGILLWDRVINQHSLHPFGVVETGFFFLFLCFILSAWFQYLSIDGIHPFSRSKTGKSASIEERRTPFSTLFYGRREPMESLEEGALEEEEVVAAKLWSSLIVAILFLIPCVLANIW